MCNQKRRGKCRFGSGGLPFLQQQNCIVIILQDANFNATCSVKIRVKQTIYCPCETGSQTPEHVLQFCRLHREERTQHWPKEPSLQKSSGTLK